MRGFLRARPIKTPFDDDAIRRLEHTLRERDAGAVVLAELDRLRGALRSIQRATGPNEMRQIAGEALGGDEAKAGDQ